MSRLCSHPSLARWSHDAENSKPLEEIATRDMSEVGVKLVYMD